MTFPRTVRHRRRRRAVVGLIVALLLAAASCDAAGDPGGTPGGSISPQPSGDASVEAGGGTFRYGIGAPTAIVPPLARTADDRAVVDAVFDSLTAWDTAGQPIPAAAASWAGDDDLSVWRFTLRPGATFHDGTLVTAEDFAQSWANLVAEGNFGYLLSDVIGYEQVVQGQSAALSGVRVDGRLTLEVRLKRPRADFATVVGHPALGPIHPEQPVGEGAPQDQPLGNGPFLMTEPWARGDFIRAARWDDWSNGAHVEGGIAEVLFRIGDLDINYLAFTQGRRDLTGVPNDALALAAQEYPHTGGEWNGPGLITGGRPEVYVLALNRSVPPYDDPRVREAVSLIVDRALIAEQNEGGNLEPASTLLPPSLPGVRRDTCELCTYNPVGAAERLDAAGVSQLTIAFNAAGGHERIRDVLRQALSDIGVALVSNRRQAPPTLATYQERLEEGGVGLFRLPLVADVPSALSVLHPLLHADQLPSAGGLNYMRYDNPTVTALLDQAARTANEVSRQSLIRRVEHIVVNRDHVLIPLFTYQHAVVAADQVQNLRYSPMGLVNLTEITLE